MGIEILLEVLVFPVARKVGEKWIDRIATGIDTYSIDLLKQVVSDPTKEREVKDYFRGNPNLADKVEQNIASTMQSGDIAASIAATVVPSTGEILKYYAELLNWIGRYGSKLGRHFVLKGFLNGELFLSYFIFDPRKVEDVGKTNSARVVSNLVRYETFPGGMEIYVEEMRSAKARDEKFVTMNRKSRLSQFGRLPHDDYGRFDQLESIYENYVWYRRGIFDDISKLSPQQQEQLEITTLRAPVQTMIQSLWELFEHRIALREDLRKTIEGIRS